MADLKISVLTSATLPLAGTEVLPIVQGGATVKVALNAFAAGNVKSQSTTGVLQVTGPGAGATRVVTVPDANWTAARTDAAQVLTGDQSLTAGNIVQVTAAKGINFTANTPAAGMTSQLLNWYEEGTWTPTQGDGTLVGSFTSSGTYTRIGRLVTCTAILNGSTSLAYPAGSHFSGLPFGVNKYAVGIATNSAGNQTVAFLCYTDRNVYSSGLLGPNTSLTVTFTYTTS